MVYVSKGLQGRWKATIKHQGKKNILGLYDLEEEAARAFDRAAIKYRGPGARTNFPIADYSDDLPSLLPDADALATLEPPVKRARTAPPPSQQLLDQPLIITTDQFKPKGECCV